MKQYTRDLDWIKFDDHFEQWRVSFFDLWYWFLCTHTHMSNYFCMYVYVGKDFLNFYIVTKIWIQNKCSSQISISHFSSFCYACINMLWFFKENNATLSKTFFRKKRGNRIMKNVVLWQGKGDKLNLLSSKRSSLWNHYMYWV